MSYIKSRTIFIIHCLTLQHGVTLQLVSTHTYTYAIIQSKTNKGLQNIFGLGYSVFLMKNAQKKPFPTWINQPSKLQSYHAMHGTKGIAFDDEKTIGTNQINFIEDNRKEIITVPRLSIQDGSIENYIKRVFLNTPFFGF